MIAVVFGTTGELIKLAPVIHEIESRGGEVALLCTGQQVRQLPDFLEDFGLRAPDVWLGRGHRGADLEHKSQVPVWAATVAGSVARRRGALRARLRADGREPFVLVHGDTMTTVLGALIGRALRAKVGHIEAGLRSHDWRNPFPEELNRRVAAKLTHVHFAPNDRAVANLRAERVRGDIVDTQVNTICDALELASARGTPAIDVPDEPFGIVSVHRFELIEREHLFRPLLELLHEHSRREPLLFVDHSVTAAVLDRNPSLAGLFDDRFRRIPRQAYMPFIALLERARHIVTDSGGCQEECAVLGTPCLIHRAVSERHEGFDGSVVMSRMDLGVVRDFLADPDRHRLPARPPGVRASAIIADELARRGAL